MSRRSFASAWRIVILLTFFLSLIQFSQAGDSVRWISTTDAKGKTVHLADNRKPTLYTRDFGDCLGSSQVHLTRFNAALYRDNLTVVFHFKGSTTVTHENLMMYIGVFAYGESRFELTFDPCLANMYSLCPMNASVPIEAEGFIPVSPTDIDTMPAIAGTIPDFEGQVIARMFANSTQSEIGCYSSIVTNGVTLAHPRTVGSILALFLLAAVVSSAALAIYGTDVSSVRNHFAHSPSIFVAFSILHHIYFTGALSMDWPSVLPAFWSNYAWFSGMIYSEKMQNSITRVAGIYGGKSILGAAASGYNNTNVGGGYDSSSIYRDSSVTRDALPGTRRLLKRLSQDTANTAASGFSNNAGGWHGSPVRAGLPLPGNYSGFPGVLSVERIPASNAFLTGLFWFLSLIGCVVVAVAFAKVALEILCRTNTIKTSRFNYFRANWLWFLSAAVQRTAFIGFFMMTLLALFQLRLGGSSAVLSIAGTVLFILFISMWGSAGYALYCRWKDGTLILESDRLLLKRERCLRFLPWYRVMRKSSVSLEEEQTAPSISLPWWRIYYLPSTAVNSPIHEDEGFMKRFGWLSARFKESKWWFFSAWLVYEFLRASFFGAAAGHPMRQAFGLIVIEFIAMVCIILMRPFESNRLNTLMVYLLGFSKISTLALSTAFHPQFNLNRITATAIGIVIVAIQGILTVCLLVVIAVSTISTYISLTRYREEPSKKKISALVRRKYIDRVENIEKTTDETQLPVTPATESPREEPSFHVSSVKRYPKIGDEEVDEMGRRVVRGTSEFGSATSLPRKIGMPYESQTFAQSRGSQRSLLHLDGNRDRSNSFRRQIPSEFLWEGSLRTGHSSTSLKVPAVQEVDERTPEIENRPRRSASAGPSAAGSRLAAKSAASL
ncbi:hypothetical protein AJ80_06341 [Polytolypa hystricis UAMH7299]|uniref:ML-like domain-containing protein n=1 Tax=Polytolypa hystricis (strain UAMH7299) TaxID=1447883 RepID=A0A2B7XWM7_POLH7|nr:hypothetical protein AJ80_06341 [Polytolypa hystricis UAMH7299]